MRIGFVVCPLDGEVRYLEEAMRCNADLIVFPEAYLGEPLDSAIWGAKMISEAIEKPIIIGNTIVVGDKFEDKREEVAIFYENDVKKVYYCYARDQYSAFHLDLPDNTKPVLFEGKKIGIQICQDIFYPLITESYIKNGADIHICLLACGVVTNKWLVVAKGMSIIYNTTIIVVAGACEDSPRNVKQTVIAYRSGKPLLIEFFNKSNLFNYKQVTPFNVPLGIAVVDTETVVEEELPESKGKGWWNAVKIPINGNSNSLGLNIVKVQDIKKLPYTFFDEDTYVVYDGTLDKAVVGCLALQHWIGFLTPKVGAKVAFIRNIQYLYPRNGYYGVDKCKMMGSKGMFPENYKIQKNKQNRGVILRKHYEKYLELVR